MKQLERVESPYNNVDVRMTPTGRIDLEVSGATHATWHPSLLLSGHAWDAITAAAVSHPEPVNSLLLLGLGGGTCLRQLRAILPEAEMVAVEIDPEMIRLARTYMHLDELNIQVVEEDAFAFLSRPERTYDVVIDDLYHARGEDVERPCAITPDALRHHLAHLSPQGSLVMNFVVGEGHQEVFEEACDTFEHLFPQTRRIVPPYSYNEVLVGSYHRRRLLTPSKLHRFAEKFPEKLDQEHWKELRTLKLRSR